MIPYQHYAFKTGPVSRGPHRGRFLTARQSAELCVTHQDYGKYINECSEHLVRLLDIKPDDVVLDIGSGLGDMAKNISNTAQHVHCCDINEQLLNFAKESYGDEANMSFYLVDNIDQPLSFLPDGSITKAYSWAVFSHNGHYVIQKYLEDIVRVLKPKGIFRFEIISKEGKKSQATNIIENNSEAINEAIRSAGLELLHDETLTQSTLNTAHNKVVRK